MDQCLELSTEHRGPSAVLVAGVHYSGIRVDDSVLRTSRSVWHGCAERTAPALPSGVQRAKLPQRRDDGQVLSLPRGDGPEVRDYGEPGLPWGVCAGVSGGGGAV